MTKKSKKSNAQRQEALRARRKAGEAATGKVVRKASRAAAGTIKKVLPKSHPAGDLAKSRALTRQRNSSNTDTYVIQNGQVVKKKRRGR